MKDSSQKYDRAFWNFESFDESVENYKNNDHVKEMLSFDDYLTSEEINTKLCEIIEFIKQQKLNVILYKKRDIILPKNQTTG
jgi:hypothetical protein